MTIESGIPYNLKLDDADGTARDISDAVTNVSVNTPRSTQDITTLGNVGMAKLLLLVDLTGTINGLFDPAANQLHDVLKTVPTSSAARTLAHAPIGVSTGDPVLTAETLLTDYGITRAQDGSITTTAPFMLTGGEAPVWS